MKMKLMKFFGVALVATVLSASFCACSDDDDGDENYIEVTQSEIQGLWIRSYSNVYYYVTFSGNSYVFDMMDSKSNWIHRENGTYTITGVNVKADANVYYPSGETYSMMDGDKIYWENSSKNALYIWPIGAFYKSN